MKWAIGILAGLFSTLPAAPLDVMVQAETVPVDTYYANAWHLPVIHAPAAWDLSHADGVLIASCDSGVEASHPDLVNVLRADLGYNTADGTADWSPVTGHGTLVAGAAAAETNNNLGVSAIGWGAQIIPVRVTNATNGYASITALASCIRYGADHGARVISVSYAVGGYQSIDDAAIYARSRGALTFVSSGNNGTNSGQADLAGTLTIGATEQGDTIASYSNYGKYVDLSAPGTCIWTTWTGGRYDCVSGTSLSTPVAAGIAALVFALHPEYTAAQAESVLRQGAIDLGSPGSDAYFGDGRMDALGALSASPVACSPPNAKRCR